MFIAMNKVISIFLALTSLLCFWLSGIQSGRVVGLRADYRLNSALPIDNAPPLIAFTTVALGGFSTLIADVLWFRVTALQEEGRYVELVQLSDWITKLEPRCGEIWAFHAWNMAYNVSVIMPYPEDRWRWVRKGIELLRDEGIRYNPGDQQVYRELGWLFLNKVGGKTDETHQYYKDRWAEEMTALLGGGYPDYRKLEQQPVTVKRMAEEYKLRLEVMRRIDEEYGPLDWRLPQSHAVYWAVKGRDRCWDEKVLPCERMILQAVKESFVRGRMIHGTDGRYHLVPATELFEKIMKAHDTAQKKYPLETYFIHSKAGFMKDAVRVFNDAGRQSEARALFNQLVSEIPESMKERNFEVFINTGGK